MSLSPNTKTPLFFQRRFLPMWTALSLGVFTDNMLKQALIIGFTFSIIPLNDIFTLLPGVNKTEDVVPYAGALFALAMIIFSPISGQFADKYETRLMFRITKFVEFILMIIAAIGFYFNNGTLLLLALFLMGAQSAFFSPVRISAMPKYMKPHELVRANAYCNGGLFVANSFAYVVGGFLISQAGGRDTIAIILVLVALAGWLVVRRAPETDANNPDLKIDFNWFTQFFRMFRFVAEEPPVIRPMLGASFFFLIATAVTVAIPLYTRDTLHADGDVSTIFMLCFTVGALLGAGLCASLAKGTSGMQFSTYSMFGAAMCSLAIFFLSPHQGVIAEDQALMSASEFINSQKGWLLIGLFTATSALMGMFIVPLQAAVQRRASKTHRARLMAAGNILIAIAALLGSLAVLTITSGIATPSQMFALIAVLQLLMVGYMVYRKNSVPLGLYDEILNSEETA